MNNNLFVIKCISSLISIYKTYLYLIQIDFINTYLYRYTFFLLNTKLNNLYCTMKFMISHFGILY